MHNQGKTRDQILTDRTIKIIQRHGSILLKKDHRYMHSWTNIAAGPDYDHWSSSRTGALEIFTLKWAFAIAKLYDAKVVSVFPKKRK